MSTHDSAGEPVAGLSDNPHATSVRTLASAMLRTGLVFGAVAAVISLVAAGIVTGWPGVFGAIIGVVVGFVSSLLTIGLMRMTAAMPVESVLGVVLGGYTLKIALLLVVMMLLRDVEVLHAVAFALTVLAIVVAWAAAEVVAFQRTKIPTIIPAD